MPITDPEQYLEDIKMTPSEWLGWEINCMLTMLEIPDKYHCDLKHSIKEICWDYEFIQRIKHDKLRSLADQLEAKA